MTGLGLIRRRPSRPQSNHLRSAALSILAFVATTLAFAAHAQDVPQAAPREPKEFRLNKAPQPFNGDLRNLPLQAPVPKYWPKLQPPPSPGVFVPPAGSPSNAPTSRGNRPSAGTPSLAPAPAPITNFDGLDFANWGAGHPPDPNGDVGPTYYIQNINSSVGIFRKSDGVRVAAFTFNTLMSQGNFGNLCDTDNFGDPIVLYDSFEDRWIITDFAFTLDASQNVINPPGSFQCFAVSKSGDPVSGGWNFYSINTTGGLGDYPKFGIWPDGLYMSANMFDYAASGSFQNPRVYAFNKAQMYAGAPAVQIVSFDAPASDFTLLPANARLQAGTPPAGSPNIYSSTSQFLNAVTFYKFHVDWNHISTSTFTGPFTSLTATSWPNASVADVPSLGGNNLDPISIRAMARNQYSNIGGVESLWNVHTVRRQDTSGFAASRFYQVDVTGGTIAANATQAATYDPDGANVLHRFVPSLAVDRAGDMAMGYSTSSSTTEPAIKYAGQLATDPVNTLSQTEQLLIQGTGTQTGNCGSGACTRWGDYTAMSLDPDGCTFWYTNQYYAVDGLKYLTRIGSFSFPSCTPVTTGSLSGTVTDTASNPISGAVVALGSRTTTTDASGVYTFANLPSGTYPAESASGSGYISVSTAGVVVSDGATTTQNFSLATAPTSGCFTDTTQADFQSGVATNCDLTSSPGDVTLLNAPFIDQQSTTLGTSGVGITTTTWGGQTFTPSVTGQMTQVDINLFCSGCTGTIPNLTLSLRATSGGLPTGADLATATITGFSSGASAYYTTNFATPPTLTAGTQYALVIRPTVNPSPGTYALTRSGTSTAGADVYAGGTRVSGATSGTVWSIPLTGGVSTDAGFKVHMDIGFRASGTFVSGLKDANPGVGAFPTWSTLSWTATVPANTSLSFQIAAGNNPNGPFNFVGPDGTAATFFTTSGASLALFNGNRYLKYAAYLGTTDNTATPTLNDVTLCFTDVPAPTVTAISPNQGPTSGGTNVTITGASFTTATGVTIGGAAATNVAIVNDTTITATTPTGAAGPASVVVTNLAGSNAANTLFTYVAPPTVTAISPNQGSTIGGTGVTITGTSFTTATGVTIGGTAATNVAIVNDTTITATTPAHAAGTASVVVTNQAGSNAANTLFTYVAPPTVTAISPNQGSTIGGTGVTITGASFTTATGVTIGGTAATNVAVVNGNTITATTPAHAVGAASVVVTNLAGSNAANTLFTYVASPTVTAISASQGSTAGGTAVTITGTNFTGATGVTIGGTAATNVAVVNGSTITATTPAHAAGPASVVVTTPGGSNAANTLFTYVAPPTVTAISPIQGSTAGGTAVTITGTNFTGATGVTIGGAAATGVAVVNGNTITATTPAHAAGAASVVVTTPGGSNAANTLFTYVAPPTVTAINPNQGPTAGGTAVTITGTNFTGATGVTMGGAAATSVAVVNATTITAKTPAHAAGPASVVVTTPVGSNAANTLFTYLAPPTVTAISPNQGPTSGGTAVTITGTNFTGATGVTMGGAAATSVAVVNATTITATTPAHAAGAVDVAVTTPGGTGTGTKLYTYGAAPATTVTSSRNPSALGQTVTFTVTVTASGGTPTGSVDFKDASTTLATQSLSSGSATFTTSTLSLGSHPITAVYSGDSNFPTSTSQVLTQVVNPSCTDMFSDATAIFGANGTITGTTVGATGETGEPNHAGVSLPHHSVWCRWSAPASGPVSFDTTGSSFDTVLAAYTGAVVNALTPVASNNDISATNNRSRITFDAQLGVSYYIVVDGAAGAVGDFLLNWVQQPVGAVTYASVLPYARSVVTGTPATAFASLINAGSATASACSLALPSGFPGGFTYQTTDAANALTGTPNAPVDIAPSAVQSFMFAITPTQDLYEVEVPIIFACANTPVAQSVLGLDTLLLSASATATPDLVTIGVTPSQDGIVTLPGTSGAAFFVAATINIGAAGSITATADFDGNTLPVTLTVCQTDPATATCVNPLTAGASSTASIAAGATATYTVFVQGNGNIPFDPAQSRLFLRLKTSDGITRGATSVAVRTGAAPASP
jgi:hypothetical protein